MHFVDLNTYDGMNTVYPTCNESVRTWRKVLEGIEVEKAAAICSGGEVSFFAILPLVKKELTLIDHSYQSMYYAVGKYHAVEKLGPKEAWKAFTTAKLGELDPLFEEGNNSLPTYPLRDNYYYEEQARQFPTHAFKRLMETLCEADIEAFHANRNKIRFLHGDLNDLVDLGPFDLVYLSNALQYSGRNGYKFNIEGMVKPGGYIAFTGSAYYHERGNLDRFKHVTSFKAEARSRRPPDDQYGMSWNYWLRQKEAA